MKNFTDLNKVMDELKASKFTKVVVRAMYEDGDIELKEYLEMSTKITKLQRKLRLQLLMMSNNDYSKAS